MSRTERHAMRNGNGNEPDKKTGKLPLLGKFLAFVGGLVMAVVILLSLVLAAPRLAGMRSYVVISGSMEPSIPVGSIVYSKLADPETLEKGDVIVFYSSDATTGGGAEGVIPITHRVVENDPASGEIITKGDANADNDLSPVTYYNVEGKVIFHIPRLGYLAAPLSTVMGKVAAALILLAGYFLIEAGNSLRSRR